MEQALLRQRCGQATPAAGTTAGDGDSALRRRRCAAGFNLIEVTMSVAIVATGLLAILGVLGSALQSTRKISDETLVSNLVDDQFTFRRVFTNQYFTTVITNTQFDANGFLPVYGGAPNVFWTGNWSKTNGYYRVIIEPLPPMNGAYGSNDIIQVKITVDWPINQNTGLPQSGYSTRLFITQVARR